MSFNSEDILALLKTWKRMGREATFVASEAGAYLFDSKNGETLQFVTPEGLRN